MCDASSCKSSIACKYRDANLADARIFHQHQREGGKVSGMTGCVDLPVWNLLWNFLRAHWMATPSGYQRPEVPDISNPFFLANALAELDSVSVLQICLYGVSFGFSWGPIGWLVPSEVHDLNTRSAGQSITVFTQLMSGAIVTQVGLENLHAVKCMTSRCAQPDSLSLSSHSSSL